MPAADDDWRLQGQDAWLGGRRLTWMTWKTPRPDWDHDHCEFCWAKFGPADLEDDILTAGWVTDDGGHRICGPCFDDFYDRFHWITEGGGTPP